MGKSRHAAAYRRRSILEVGMLLLCLPVRAMAQIPRAVLAKNAKYHEVVVQRDVGVKMRDGTVLRADVYRPKAPGRFPTLVKRTPYNKLDGDGVYTSEFGWEAAADGYVVIVQDCRGRFRSEGQWYPLKYEAEDGYDTVEWASKLPYANGRVGMFGDSYFGVTATLAALANPPHLSAVFVVFPASDYGDGFAYQGGAFLQGLMEGWTSGLALNTLERDAQTKIVSPSWVLPLHEYPILNLGGIIGRELAPYFFDWLAHPNFDAYWKQWSFDEHLSSLHVPIYQVAGWYDLFLGGTLRHYLDLESRASARARRESRLLIGPWFHGPLTGKAGQLDFGPSARGDMQSLTLRWFNYKLKGIDDGIGEQQPVTYFEMGLNRWRRSLTWPPAGVQYTRFYLHSSGGANTLRGKGHLSTVMPASEPPDRYVYDPENPVPTHGSAAGAFDQRPIEGRKDVLVYSTAKFKSQFNVTGPVKAEIYASSSAVDTDFTAKLVEVWPNGYSQNLTDGIIRARYRTSSCKPEFLTPRKVYKMTVDLWATSNTFLPGHSLRLEISSSNFPRFDRNLNTGEDILHGWRMVKATNYIYHDKSHPSAIILPVLSSGSRSSQ
jgi:uncharacterized protein